MKRFLLLLLLLVLSSVFFITGCPAPAGRELVVLVGAGQGSTSINAYFPSNVQVRSGDTVTWKMNADGDPHTVTFTGGESVADIIPLSGSGPRQFVWNPKLLLPTALPGQPVETYNGTGYVNSGTFFGIVANHLGPDIPVFDAFSLVFDTPGEYEYVCIVHEFMQGTVTVEPRSATGVPSMEEIDARAQREMQPLAVLTSDIQTLVQANRVVDREAKPDGTDLWVVSAGMGPPEAEVVEFLPKRLTVSEGDTVVWTSSRYHAVVFDPDGPLTRFYETKVLPGLGPMITINSDVLFPARPSAELDRAGFYSSGLMGPGVTGFGTRPGGMGFSLTFPEPGVYTYTCPIHLNVGMTGTIVVEPR